MLRILLAATLMIAALSTVVIAKAADSCRAGQCRIERTRTVESEHAGRSRRVERVRFVRR